MSATLSPQTKAATPLEAAGCDEEVKTYLDVLKAQGKVAKSHMKTLRSSIQSAMQKRIQHTDKLEVATLQALANFEKKQTELLGYLEEHVKNMDEEHRDTSASYKQEVGDPDDEEEDNVEKNAHLLASLVGTAAGKAEGVAKRSSEALHIDAGKLKAEIKKPRLYKKDVPYETTATGKPKKNRDPLATTAEGRDRCLRSGRTIVQIDAATNATVKVYDSIKKASETLGLSVHRIKALLTSPNKKMDDGTTFRFVNRPFKPQSMIQIDVQTGQIVKKFKSKNEASIYNQISHETIQKVINGEKASYKGFIWRNVDDDTGGDD